MTDSDLCRNAVPEPTHLLCEYVENPIGIDALKPRLSWRVNHSERGQLQTGYRIVAASSIEKLKSDHCDLWDTGKVGSDQSVNIEYSGNKLASGEVCCWKVCIWDKNGEKSAFSKPAFFEMGLLDPDEWEGRWMGFPAGKNSGALYFRKDFNLERKPVKARAYICGLGYYELRINGKKTGDHVLDPGFTEYGSRVMYVTYDVTGYLKVGANTVGIIAGNGWDGSPKVIFQMNIEVDGGPAEKVISIPTTDWAVSGGPIVHNSIYDGEIYDARLEKTGWDIPGYDAGVANGWIRPMSIRGPGGRLVPQMIEPIKVVGYLEPSVVTNPKEGVYVYDIGQNMAGWVRLKAKGTAGTQITLKFAENLYDDGTVNQENLRTALCRDIYILKGEGDETYEPSFTYHGFRYVQMEGYPGKASLESITACIVRSSAEPAGKFECSSLLINKIQSAVVWTEAGNLHSIPTDCPQRDERNGWLNDATARAEEAIYNFDMSRLYSKWMDDIEDAQDVKTGALADTAPFRWGRKPADPVSSCYITIPWLLYSFYADRNVLEKHYEGMKRWMGFLESKAEKHIITFSHYGDWASPVGECDGGSPFSLNTPGELMSTGYYYFNAVLLSKIAKVLGRYTDQREYDTLAEDVKAAFNNRFFNSETAQYATGSQGCNALALFMGLVPHGYGEKVVKNLVNDVCTLHGYHLSTGNQCTKHIMEVLAEAGELETSYRLAAQITYPSWGYMISKGATTIWERWEDNADNIMNSCNHPMYAAIGSWFYKILTGINANPEKPGFQEVIIKPHVPEGLTYAKASLKTIRGVVLSSWRRNGKRFILEVTIPANSTARIYIPKPKKWTKDICIEERGKIIWANGYFGGADGITGGADCGEHIEFNTGSGSYVFEI